MIVYISATSRYVTSYAMLKNDLLKWLCSDQKKVLQKICMCNREHIVEEEDKIFVLNDLQGWQN